MHTNMSQLQPSVPLPLTQANVAAVCPPPAATYDEVVAKPETFMATLAELHSVMGTKFEVPTIGGEPLDLHFLFVEVTARGGLEKVIRDRKWGDVVSLFSFPSTAANASFLLRKHYMSLLQGYEQIYFLKAEDKPNSPENQDSPSKDTASMPSPRQCGTTPAEILDKETEEKLLEVGSSVIGTIDGKIEEGYLVTVNCGSKTLQGVLYHPACGSPNLSSPTSVSYIQRRKERKKKLPKDPSKPKRNRSGYTYFFAEQCAKLMPSYRGERKSMTQKIGQLWNNLTDVERKVYQDLGLQDKERYESEMLDYDKAKS